jgi:hypothetical protein
LLGRTWPPPPQDLWPGLLEKAYAWLHGGYASLDTRSSSGGGGSVARALVDVTGGLPVKIKVRAAGSAADGLTPAAAGR